MTADELYAWEVANIPWIMFTIVMPVVAVVGGLLRLRVGARYRQGYRDAHRDQRRNMGL